MIEQASRATESCPTHWRALKAGLVFATLGMLIAGCTSGGASTSTSPEPAESSIQSDDGVNREDLPEVKVDANGERSFPEQTHQEMLDVMWEEVLASLPEGAVSPERPSVSLVAYQESMGPYAECLKQQGWSQTKYFPDVDEVEVEVPAGQSAAFDISRYTCYGQYPKKMRPPMNEREIGELWQWSMDESIPCLAREGYTVTGFPSKGAFVDGYFAERTYKLPASIVDAPSDVIDRCPQFPESLRD